jgi:hypothetical protein
VPCCRLAVFFTAFINCPFGRSTKNIIPPYPLILTDTVKELVATRDGEINLRPAQSPAKTQPVNGLTNAGIGFGYFGMVE